MTVLERIANDMRSRLQLALATGQAHAWTSHELPLGLEIILSVHDADSWRLALRSETTPPSPDEVETVRSAFGVPAEAEPTARKTSVTRPATGRKATLQVVELTWRESVMA